MKRLIVNADDFGASEGVNGGILECHVHGIVTSASLMVDGAAAREAAAAAREHARLSLGLHFVDDGRDLADALARQLDSFERLVGRPPTHVDSHHHFHLDEDVFPRFRELVEPLGVPLRGDGRIAWIGGFYAQWEVGVTNLEYVGVPFLERLLREEVSAGWTELSCHPGYRSPGFASSYLAEREAEVRTLTDPRLGAILDELGIGLATYRDLEATPATADRVEQEQEHDRAGDREQEGAEIPAEPDLAIE